MKTIKKYLNRLFIDGLSGMALGLFATLIIGTIICQIGSFFKGSMIGDSLISIGNMAKTITGAGIGVGVAAKLKQSPLVTVGAAVCGMIGAFPNLSFELVGGKPGEPLGAFVAAYVAIEVGRLVSGKTKLDIILTPLATIVPGAVAGYLIGPPISDLMNWIGNIVEISVDKHPIINGMIVSVVMGILLTLPISSAAIGVSTKIGGLAAGAAVMGCCCNMVGFAVASYRENKMGGFVAQGVGTSMLQMPNIVRKPIIWLPAIISSAIMGPISAAAVKMQCSFVGAGMGTSGLVGQFETFSAMTAAGVKPVVVIIEIIGLQIIAPAVLSFVISEAMRKLNLIKPGDMKLDGITK